VSPVGCVGAVANKLTFVEVDGDGTLIFEVDDSREHDPSSFNVDVLQGFVSSVSRPGFESGKTRLPDDVAEALRKAFRADMLHYMQSLSGLE
jgi:hypothetical protein